MQAASEIKIRHLPAIYALWALEWEWQIFLGQSIGIDDSNTYQLKFISIMEIGGATGLGGLRALKWAWHLRVTNLHCVHSPFSIFYSF